MRLKNLVSHTSSLCSNKCYTHKTKIVEAHFVQYLLHYRMVEWKHAVTRSRVVLDTVCMHCNPTLAADGQFGTILERDVCLLSL